MEINPAKDEKNYIQNIHRLRVRNIENLLDGSLLKTIFNSFPAIAMEDKDFPSFKYNIMKYLSWNGEDLIRNLCFYGFDADVFPSQRYRELEKWDKFNILSLYSGPFYEFFKKYCDFSRKVLIAPDFNALFRLKQDFIQLYSEINQNVKTDMLLIPKYLFELFQCHEVYYRDYSGEILWNLMDESNFHFLIENREHVPLIDGFYKSILVLIQLYFGNPYSNTDLNKFFQSLEKKGSQYISPLEKLSMKREDPIEFWPWMYIRYLRDMVIKYGKSSGLME